MSALKPQQSQFASKVAGKERGGEDARKTVALFPRPLLGHQCDGFSLLSYHFAFAGRK